MAAELRDQGRLAGDAARAVRALAETDPALTVADGADEIARAVLDVVVTREALSALWAAIAAEMLGELPAARAFESEFADAETGQRYRFTLERVADRPAAADEDQRKARVRARGNAFARLARMHQADFDALVAEELADLGALACATGGER